MTRDEPARERVLEVFADVWCPFTHVGLRRLVEARDRRGRDDLIVRVRAWPLELVNGKALSPDLVAEEIQALHEAVAPDLFTGFDRERFPTTTLPALAVAAAAYRRDNRTGERMSLALRTALFEEGRDISDPAELAAIAHTIAPDLGYLDDEPAIHDDWDEGRRRGVIGSPHFFIDDHSYFCPTLAIEHVDDHLKIRTDPDGFSAFVAAAFGSPVGT
jgi:predicted DsbA family dithiol-disulfide isomerase